MKKIISIIFVSLIFANIANATQFLPISIENQIKEADFAVEATLDSLKVYKNINGLVVSQYNFLVNEGFGTNDKEIRLEIPGGTLDGVTTLIESGPVFNVKEKTFLLLKKIESKIYLSNFTMGEYKIINIDGKTFYRSLVFAHDAALGMVTKEKMRKLLLEKWESASSSSSSNLLMAKVGKAPPPQQKQSPKDKKANGKDTKAMPHAKDEPEDEFDGMFKVLILGVGGVVVFLWLIGILISRKKNK